MEEKDIVSSLTHYGDEHLLLEYDRGDLMFYDLPAGSKESDEGSLDGMLREFDEETGLELNDIESITALRPYTYCREDTTYRVYPFDIELSDKKSPESLDSQEHDGYRWVNSEGLRRAGLEGWLSPPKFFNASYVKAGMNGQSELRGQENYEKQVFRHEEINDNVDDLEALIDSKLMDSQV